MQLPLRRNLPRAIALVSLLGVLAASPDARADLTIYYQENFTGQAGEGIIDPGTYSNSSWSVNGTSAPSNMGHAQVTPAPEQFEFYELAGTGNNGNSASVLFETAAVAISVGNPASLSYLRMSLDATLAGVSSINGDGLVIQSVINNVAVETTTLTLNNAGEQVIHDLAPYILLPDTQYNYVLRVTATQISDNSVTSSFTIDNIIVAQSVSLAEGVSAPEPASMSLLGMGMAAMCAAGYRRRQMSERRISG